MSASVLVLPDRLDALARTARRAWRLPLGSWGMMARVVPTLAAVRLALWVLPYRVVARRFDVDPQRVAAGPTKRPAYAVAVLRTAAWAGRTLFADRPCLTQALGARWLLGRAGFASELKLGARRAAGGGIEAHAWLEVDGQVVIGQMDPDTPFQPFRSVRSEGGPPADTPRPTP